MAAHQLLVQRYGGTAGLRDANLLESALMRPQNRFTYEAAGQYEVAAAYAYGLAKNHPFFDGNKRVAFMAAYLFLRKNGQKLEASESDATAMTLQLASGEIDETAYADWLRRSCVEG